MRKDVQQKFPDRVIITKEYQYSYEEEKLYDAILNVCRRKYSDKKIGFSLIMPERRAASSLVAMINSLKEESWEAMFAEYIGSLEVADGNDNNEKSIKAKTLEASIASIF